MLAGGLSNLTHMGSSILIVPGLSDPVGSGNVKETHPFQSSAFVDTVTNFVRGIVLQLKKHDMSEYVRDIRVSCYCYHTKMFHPWKHET
jgi:hypothetical protein